MNKAQSGKASGMSVGRLFRAVWTGVVPLSLHKFRGARLASPFAPTGLAPVERGFCTILGHPSPHLAPAGLAPVERGFCTRLAPPCPHLAPAGLAPVERGFCTILGHPCPHLAPAGLAPVERGLATRHPGLAPSPRSTGA